MDLIFVLFSVLQSVAISLGVGCSTAAIVSFFVAIKDGTIGEGERRIMGVLYTLLRVAMVLILATTTILAYVSYSVIGDAYLTGYSSLFWVLIAVLFGNAVLMTKHLMPSSIGPGIQASAWYSMGVLVALPSAFVVETKFLFLLVWYVGFSAIVTLLVYALVQLSKKNAQK